MDFKINLPTEECTCDAKLFYDKYRKQVDNFIQNELEIAKTTTDIVVGRKAVKKVKSGTSYSEKSSVLSKQSSQTRKIIKKKIVLPKIKGALFKKTGEEESKSVSGSTSTTTTTTTTTSTETHLPKIKVTKKWSDDLLSSSFSSLEVSDVKPSFISSSSSSSSLDIKKILRDIKIGKKIKKVEPKKQVIVGERRKEAKLRPKKQIIDESRQKESILPSKTKEIFDVSQQKKTTPWLKSSSSSEKEISISTLEYVSTEEIKPTETKKIDSKLWQQKKQLKGKDKKKPEKFIQKKEDKKLSSSSSSSETELSLFSFDYSSEKEKKATKVKKKPSISWKNKQKIQEYEKPLKPKENILIITKDPKSEEERVALQLSKKKKEDDFVSLVISKSKKEGLGDNFMSGILAEAKAAGHEEDLLFSLSKANIEGTLDALLFKMWEAKEKGEVEDLTTNLINEGKEKRRKSMLLKLINAFKRDHKDDSYVATLIAKAKEEDPDDELILILSKAVEENNLNDLMSSLSQAKKHGQLDDMISILVKKGKKEQEKQLLSAIKIIVQEKGKDSTLMENLLAKAKETGQKDEFLSKLMKAKIAGNLDEVVSILANATEEDPINNLLKSRQKQEESIQKKKDLSDIFLDEVFDEDFLAKWFSKARNKKEENILFEKLSKIIKRGKSVDFSALTLEKSIEDMDDLFSLITEVLSEDESDEVDEIDVITVRDKKSKVSRRKNKQFKRLRKHSKEFRQRKTSADERAIRGSRAPSVLQTRPRKSKIEKMKQQLLYQRQYSYANSLPDIDYNLVGRHRLTIIDLTEPEKSDEEEHVYEQKIEKTRSKMYRESFLRKIYGDRKIGPTPPEIDSTVSSSSDRAYTTRKRPLIKKPKLRKQPITVVEKKTSSPRKVKKHVVTYVKKKSIHIEKEFSDDTDISSFDQLLEKKISRICEIDGEERSERGYLVGFRYKDDDETFDWRKKPKKTSMATESTYSEDWISRARRRAINYFDSRKIEDLFHFLGSHLVSDKPENPIEYLILLLESCIQFRSGIGRPPLLFEHYHVESLYYSMDIFHKGFISLDQYRTGMKTLFIKEFISKPRTIKKNMVSKDTFIYEALKWQRIQLKDMLRGSSETMFRSDKNSNSTLGTIWSKVELYRDKSDNDTVLNV